MKSLATALILNSKIKTTEAKAKELKSFIEKKISCVKKGNLHQRRRMLDIFAPPVAKKLFEEIGPKYKERPGGYTRIIKLGRRPQDKAEMAIIELV